MTPAFTSKFFVTPKQVRVTDTFNYSAIIRDAIYANITAKVGNSAFHQGTDYSTGADIVIGTNTYKDIDLPLSDSTILNGLYSITENVKIINEVLYRSGISSGFMAVAAPGANNFTQIQLITPIASLIADIAALQDTHDDVRLGFYTSGGTYLGTTGTISCNDDDLITFAAVSISAYATIAKIRVIGSNIYSTTDTYTWTGCALVTPKIQATTDCYRSQMTIIDCTAYIAGQTLARTLTAQYPTLADGSHVVATVTASEASITLGPNIWTGGYTIDLSSVLTYQQDDDLYVEQTVTAQITPTVTCNSGLCALSSCITKFFNKYKAGVANGSKNMAGLTTDMITIGGYVDLINIAVQCEDTTTAAALTTALNTFMGEGSTTEGCDCGCSGSTTNTIPTEIFPLFSTPSTDGKLVVYNSGIPYPVMQQVYYEGQVFLVTTATTAGQSPISTRGKFKYLSGGVNTGNNATNTAGGVTATLNHNSGIIEFTGLTPVTPGNSVAVTITNTTIQNATDVELAITGAGDGYAVVVNKTITANTILAVITNTSVGDNLFEFTLWFNNKA